jgi:hypothetical protein
LQFQILLGFGTVWHYNRPIICQSGDEIWTVLSGFTRRLQERRVVERVERFGPGILAQDAQTFLVWVR